MGELFGLSWTDIFINVMVLALLPGFFAAYGGHIAAEAVPDTKRQRRIKGIFWAMFAIFVLATGWQQIRVAEADLSRDTRETWADALALQKLQPNLSPPEFAYLKQILPVRAVPIARSYVIFDGKPHFTEDIVNGQITAQRDFRPGDSLSFNVYYKQEGPNPLDVLNTSRWLYVESNTDDRTENSVISDFERRLQQEQNNREVKFWTQTTLTIGESRYFTVFARQEKEYEKVTEDVLNQLRSGQKILFVVNQIIYRDQDIVHHLRRCLWLQPPALAPGVWHFCNSFNRSD